MPFRKNSAAARISDLTLPLSLSLSVVLAGLAGAAPDSVVTFNEIHYHPQEDAAPEWVELHNQMSVRVNIGGWTLRGGMEYTFPENTVMEPGALLVVSSAAGAPPGAAGPFSGKLDNKGEELRLHERWGRMMDEVTFGDNDPWPREPDGSGRSLAKMQPNSLSGEPAHWKASAQDGGTPGAENFPAETETSPRFAALAGTDWKYDLNHTAGAGAGADWVALTGFDDSGWGSWSAPLATSQPATTLLPAGQEVYRFRKSFGYTGGISHARLLVTGVLKGQAEIFLNGQPQTVFTGSGSGEFGAVLKPDTLSPGSNVLAIALKPTPETGAALDLALTIIDGETGLAAPPSPHPAGPVVINEISYHARPRYPDPAAGVTFAEDPSEWIELHNRSADPADLGGWRLRGAADYDFPAGTVLAGGGFLVVNRGQFSGTLGNQSDTLRLRDAADALADEVRYFDSGRWPSSADGGGSTLELTDPAADNRRAESWAASDESAKSAWKTVTYRSTGAEPPGSNNPSVWREFLFGLLDAGEVLIDDVSVIEDPDGTKLQLIQNGTFENDTPGGGAARWRLLGTHRLSRVEATENGKALRLVATDEMEHTYNCASTTLAGNRALVSTRTYEISYRARWLSGSPQLNSRLYLNRAARTTILPQPASAGTPGAPNSRRTANAAPVFENLRHSPLVPAAGEPVRVSAAVADADGLSAVRLFYSVGGGAWNSARMGGDAGGTWFGVIPGQAQNALVQFYIEAADGRGATAWFPRGGKDSRALYRVGDGGISTQPVRNKLRLLMTAADGNDLHNVLQSVSNFRRPCTVIYNDREVWYEGRVRLRSAPYGRQGNRAGWNILFGSDAPFRGSQKSVVVDGAFNMPRTDGSGWTENSLGASVNEMLFHAIANRAGGIPASYDDIIYFQTPRAAEGNRRAQLKLTRFGSGYLEEAFPDGGEGSIFKQELIYYPNATVDGNPESLKNAYNAVLDTEIRSFGPSKDSYRFNYLAENHRDRDDYSGIMALGKAFDSTSANLYTATSAAMDADEWMRVSALIALTGLADTYNNGLAHNIVLYARPSDGKVLLFPWDQDHAFYYAATSSIYGTATHRLRDVIQLPANRRLYCAHLLDICSSAFTTDYLNPVINHLNTVAGKDSYSATFRNWVTQRRNYVMTQVRSQYPAVAFAITTSAGADFSVNAPHTVLEGEGGIDVREIRVARNGADPLPAAVTWLDAKRWRITVPLKPGPNALTLTAAGAGGTVLSADSITVTNSGTTAPADASNLMVSEIHYHPSGGAPEEFVELLNTSPGTVSLTGLRFTNGIRFDFPTAAVVPLEAGQRVLIVGNRAAFEARYGTGLPVAGEFSVLTQLSNGGDRLTLLDMAGAVIADFSYGTSLPWAPEADGGGRSLTRISNAAAGLASDPSSWRPSRSPGGSPGAGDALAASGFPSLTDYALTVPPAPVPLPPGGGREVTWTERLGADAAAVRPEVSADLLHWQRDPGDGTLVEILSATAAPDGQRILRARTAPTHPFFRLRIESR